MPWDEDFAEQLPGPLSNEPADLRGDIQDELADHLECALARERKAGVDDETARRQVLSKFGDPHKIARQLWYDSMKGQIMSQRLVVALVCLLVVSSLTIGVMSWQVATQRNELNHVLLERIEALERQKLQPTSAPPSMDWNPMSVQCLSGGPDPKPVSGIEVEIDGHLLSTSATTKLRRTTDENGIADFGVVHPGYAILEATDSWKEKYHGQFVVLPGQTHLEKVICPAAAPAMVDVKYAIDWPEDLRDKDLAFVARFVSQGGRFIAGAAWYPPNITEKTEIIDSRGQVFDARLIEGLGRFKNAGDLVARYGLRVPNGLTQPRAGNSYPEQRYALLSLMFASLAHPRQSSEVPGAVEFALVANFAFDRDPHDDSDPLPRFFAKPNEVNTWNILVTDRQWERLRELLAKQSESDEGHGGS